MFIWSYKLYILSMLYAFPSFPNLRALVCFHFLNAGNVNFSWRVIKVSIYLSKMGWGQKHTDLCLAHVFFGVFYLQLQVQPALLRGQ